MKRRITLHLHHSISQEIRTRSPQLLRWRILAAPALLLEWLGQGAFHLCYWAGLVVIYCIQLPYRAFRAIALRKRAEWETVADSGAKWARTVARARVKFHRFLDPQVRLTVAIFAVLLLVSVGLFRSAQIVNTAWEYKARILGAADSGLNQMNAAAQSLKTQETDVAEQHFLQALTNFQEAQTGLNSVGGVINGLLDVLPQKRDASNLLSAAGLISKAGLSLTQFYATAQNLHFGAQGLNASRPVSIVMRDMGVSLHAGVDNITQASQLMADINPGILPENQRLAFTQARDKISVIRTGLRSVTDLFDTLTLLAQGDKRILLLSENNNELRPGGGFIGTYGDIKLHQGSIVSMHVSSIYDLDGQLKDCITPPRPLWAVNTCWYMRDSNWFFDFAQTARKVSSFYEKEGGETPDMVIAMTPNLIVDMLKVTGPVDMPAYGIILSADNFVEQTQFETSINYDKTLNRPKQFLADFVPQLLQRISDLPHDRLVAAIEAVQRNLAAKQLLIYSRDADIQGRISEFNWGGQVKNTDRDYLGVVTANLSGTKTDLAINQDISLHSEINDQGAVTNTVTITRTNPLPNRPGMENRSFVRVFVPRGSVLLGTQGFSTVPLPNSLDNNGRTDPDVYEWEKHAVKDVLSDTLIGEETGKTFFGNWMVISGQGKATASITYRLPFTLQATDHYSLLVQKQPGSVNQHFAYDFNLGAYQILWQNSDMPVSNHTVSVAQSNLVSDRLLGMVVSNK